MIRALCHGARAPGYDARMQMFWDFLPLIAFFVSFKLGGIYVATLVLIGAALVQLVVHRLRAGSFKPLHLLVSGLAVVLGGATLVLHDQRFIQWKASVLFWILALVCLGSQFIGARPLVERLFEATTEVRFTLTAGQWRRLNLLWVLFYALLGALNLYVARNFSLDTWATFKMFGLTGLMFLFLLPQAFWLAARAQDRGPDGATDKPSTERTGAGAAERQP
jgi:intracellular septation protein